VPCRLAESGRMSACSWERLSARTSARKSDTAARSALENGS
jgi:hypothetical protein